MNLPFGQTRERLSRHYESTMHPAGYHGDGKTRDYFEGWYVKLISADRQHRFAVIPGLFRGSDGSSEAFVQVLDGLTGQSWYHEYDAADFHADPSNFDVRVGPNHFTDRGVVLDLPSLHGEVAFEGGIAPWPVTVASPGIMGWFAWIPTMECYHGLVSFNHVLSGQLTHEHTSMDFSGGRGYIEKDWGQAFPSGYVWMQSNHFPTAEVSLSASIAIIPWRKSAFRGFIVGLWRNGELTKFATYTGAKTRSLEIDDNEVRWSLASRSGLRLDLTADRVDGGLLHAPIRTEMHRRVEETLNSSVRVRLTDRTGNVLFDEVGECAGLEVHGDLDELTAMT